MGMPELEIYSMIGAEGFARLVAAFYRQVPQSLAPPHGWKVLEFGSSCCLLL